MTALKGTLEELKMTSISLQTDLDAMVYLPPNYSPLYTYPLVIAEDGQDYFNLGRIRSLADQLISEKRVCNMIIVGIPYKEKKQRWHRYHPDGDDHENFLHFLSRELLKAIEERYAVSQLGSSRYLIGDSLGGAISLIAALRYPHTFGNVIMQSPFVNDAMIKKMETFKEAPQLTIYHSIGTKETAVETTWGDHADFLATNQKLHEVMVKKVFAAYHYEEIDGNHTWTYWQKDLKKALLTMFQSKF